MRCKGQLLGLTLDQVPDGVKIGDCWVPGAAGMLEEAGIVDGAGILEMARESSFSWLLPVSMVSSRSALVGLWHWKGREGFKCNVTYRSVHA